MPYQSIDQLQKVLASTVFHYTQDAKKASGRALGTLVEIITFYLLKAWGYENSIAIERGLAEYGNPEITHNVEFSLHPILRSHKVAVRDLLPITSTRVLDTINQDDFPLIGFQRSGSVLLTSDLILRNSCTIAFGPS